MTLYSTAPAIGLGRHLWQRHRIGISIVLAYLLLLILIAHLPALHLPPTVVYMSSVPFGLGILYLMAIVTHSEADVAAQASGYPSYLLTLPIPTWELAVWPMVYGAATVAAAWVALAALVLLPNGAPVSPTWPAGMLAAITVSLQAIFWSPLGLRYLRLALVVFVVSGIIAATVFAVNYNAPPGLMALMFAGMILAACAFAWQGVTRARHGALPYFTYASPVAQSHSPDRSMTLPVAGAGDRQAWSPMVAQCWYEWRQTGLMLPLVVGSICLVMSAPLLWIHECTPLFDHPVNGWLADVEINLYFRTYLMQPWLLPPFVAAIAGYSSWSPQAKSQDRSLPLYLATRPLRDLDIVMTRARVAVGSALVTWAVLFLFVVVWTMSPAKDGDINAPLLFIVARHLTWQPLPAYALALVWLVAWTWRNQAIALISGFADRAWIVRGYPAVVHGSLFVACVVGLLWTSDPVRAPSPDVMQRVLICWIIAAICLKAVVTGWSFRSILRNRLASPLVVGKTVGLWLIMVAALWASIRYWLHAGLFASVVLPPLMRAAWFSVAIAILCVPIARLSLAPLTLFWNRHR